MPDSSPSSYCLVSMPDLPAAFLAYTLSRRWRHGSQSLAVSEGARLAYSTPSRSGAAMGRSLAGPVGCPHVQPQAFRTESGRNRPFREGMTIAPFRIVVPKAD